MFSHLKVLWLKKLLISELEHHMVIPTVEWTCRDDLFMKHMDVDKSIHRPHVFLDILIDNALAGKIIIELFSDETPKTCENFLALCTGFSKTTMIHDMQNELNEVYLHYKGTIINKAVPYKYIECGNLSSKSNSGFSIYGQFFDDENFTKKHDKPGVVSMINEGSTNTNNSKFMITTTPIPELDEKSVVFGQVVKGMGVVKQIQNIETDNDNNIIKKCVIQDCGIYDPSSIETGSHILDGIRDWYADWPDDHPNLDKNDVQNILNIATHIKHFGKLLFKKENYTLANEKYIKALRYLNAFTENPHSFKIEENGMILNLITTCILNSAACKIKMHQYQEAIQDCDEALDLHPHNAKALFRRAQSLHGLHRYEESLKDLNLALKLKPHDKAMMAELIAIKGEMQVYKIKT